MSIYGGEEKVTNLSETAEQVITGILVVCVFVAMGFEKPPDVVFLIVLVVIMLMEILTLKEVLAGFANESLITIGSLFLVVGAVQKSHVMELLAKKAFGIRSSNKMGTMRMLVSLASLSAVFNNIPLCNLMIPIVRDWARARGIPLSHLLMPLSYTVIAGGLCTMIGTSTSLIVQGLMQEDIGYSFPFFTPGVIAVPASIILIAYMIFCAPIILPSRSGLIREVRDKAADFIAEVEVLEGSVFIDHDIATMMGRLGLQQDSVIKIRRPIATGDVDASHHSFGQSQSVTLKNADIELVLTNRGAARGRTESENLPPHIVINGKEHDAKAFNNENGSIADVEYVQQSRGAWGVPSDSGAADDIAVHGYRPVRLSARGADLSLGQPGSFDASLDMGGNMECISVNKDGTQTERSDSGLGGILGSSRYRDIINPNQFDVVKGGDIVFIASAAEVVTKVLKSVGSERAGLKLLDSSVLDLPGFGSELIELTLSGQNPFIGQSMGACSAEFASRYKVGIISTRSRGQNADTGGNIEEGAGSSADEDIENGDHIPDSGVFFAADSRSVILATGDMVLCLAKTTDINDLRSNKDFFVASTVGSVPPVMSLYGMIPVGVFLVMICLVAAEYIRMCPAALSAVALFFIGGWLKAPDIPKMVDLRLLMLMGCSISFAASMESSGLASTVARTVISFLDPSPQGALYVMYILTLAVTETMSNNAAAAIMYPLASAIAKELGVSVIPFALVVLVGATAAFMSPIGYQTHLMVWAPGGYKFSDFIKFGFFADMTFWLLTCAIAPVLFPL